MGDDPFADIGATDRNGPAGNGRLNGVMGPAPSPEKSAMRFAKPKRCSELKADVEGVPWIWHGYLARGAITLLSALWKAGKTTMLANLLRALQQDESFCGLPVSPSKILYVTEESEQRWAERRDCLGLDDHCRFVVRPFMLKPRFSEWLDFLKYLRGILAAEPAELVVFDTLSNLWPVRDENDNAQVQGCLMPLQSIVQTHACGLLLLHHLGKADVGNLRGSRGAGALPAIVDIVLELRHHNGGDHHDRRRVLTGKGRWDDTPDELVLELLADGLGYRAWGDRQEVARRDLRVTIFSLLPTEAPGMTWEEVRDRWPGDNAPKTQRLLDELRRGVEAADWRQEGAGKKGSPFTYWVQARA